PRRLPASGAGPPPSAAVGASVPGTDRRRNLADTVAQALGTSSHDPTWWADPQEAGVAERRHEAAVTPA
ncbi:hypothetical protein, partial [Streptomyces sp. GC420]|uniref:hypothetical protein n=1 Tax=Streptomyces sp. GC420 TaxID=2697568 RepID=UPI001AA17ACD